MINKMQYSLEGLKSTLRVKEEQGAARVRASLSSFCKTEAQY